jgi:hypothetical protein
LAFYSAILRAGVERGGRRSRQADKARRERARVQQTRKDNRHALRSHRSETRQMKTLGEIVYKAMIDLINVPHDDKFQVITEHDRDDLNFAETYLGNK